jgi:hypothetical protein
MDPLMDEISDCDKRYESQFGKPAGKRPECGMCRKLLEIGYLLSQKTLPMVCVNYCARWDVSTA